MRRCDWRLCCSWLAVYDTRLGVANRRAIVTKPWLRRGLLGLLLPVTALPYAILIHDRLPDVFAAEPLLQVRAALPDETGLTRFRTAFYHIILTCTEPALRARFLRRYPAATDFTGQAFKELLGMSAIKPALAFDAYSTVENEAEKTDLHGPIRPGQARTLLEWIRIGSLYPDLDRRNQSRWWVVNGQIQRSSDGQQIPYDPVILNMGRVERLSGQAHAHYGLNRHPKSDDPKVLKQRPADFAVRIGFPQAPVLTFAPERAQAYGDLALIAQYLHEPALAALFAGNAFHYLGDVANQIHTIQVGIYDFFVDATLEFWKLNFLRLGGLLGPVMERNQIGIDIIGSHHTWLEEMFRISVQRALAGKPLDPALSEVEDLFRADPQSEAAWATLPATGPMLRELCDRIILLGNVEGPAIYALARRLTKSDLRRAGVNFDFSDQTDERVLAYLAAGANPRELARLFTLEKLGTRRAATAMALWWRSQFSGARSIEMRKVSSRLLQQQLDELDAADERRKLWTDLHRGAERRP